MDGPQDHPERGGEDETAALAMNATLVVQQEVGYSTDRAIPSAAEVV